jgi:phage gp46-like protein
MSARIWLLRRRTKRLRRVCHAGLYADQRAWRVTVSRILTADEAKARHPRYALRGVRVSLAC